MNASLTACVLIKASLFIYLFIYLFIFWVSLSATKENNLLSIIIIVSEGCNWLFSTV